MSISERLKELRDLNNMTQQQFGEAIGLTKDVIWKYEQNRTTPTPETLKKISLHFGVSTDYLIFDETDKKEIPQIYDKEIAELFEEISGLEPKRKKNVLHAIKMILGKE